MKPSPKTNPGMFMFKKRSTIATAGLVITKLIINSVLLTIWNEVTGGAMILRINGIWQVAWEKKHAIN